MKQLSQLRHEIDQVDTQIVQLLNERIRIALLMGRVKARKKTRIYDPGREQVVLRKAVAAAQDGPIGEGSVRRIFERVIAETRRAQRDERGPAIRLVAGRSG